MKRFSNFFVALGVTLFLLTVGIKSEADAQCPPGSSSQTFIFTVGGCDWIADICYQCPFTAHPNWFTVGKYKKVNSTCIGSVPADDVKDSIIAQMIDGRVWLYGLCASSYPPCGLDPKTIQIRDYDCWLIYNDNGDYEYRICVYGSFCVQDVEVCWDQTYGPQHTPSGVWYHYGDSYCEDDIMPGFPPNGYASDCWFNSICDQ